MVLSACIVRAMWSTAGMEIRIKQHRLCACEVVDAERRKVDLAIVGQNSIRAGFSMSTAEPDFRNRPGGSFYRAPTVRDRTSKPNSVSCSWSAGEAVLRT